LQHKGGNSQVVTLPEGSTAMDKELELKIAQENVYGTKFVCFSVCLLSAGACHALRLPACMRAFVRVHELLPRGFVRPTIATKHGLIPDSVLVMLVGSRAVVELLSAEPTAAAASADGKSEAKTETKAGTTTGSMAVQVWIAVCPVLGEHCISRCDCGVLRCVSSPQLCSSAYLRRLHFCAPVRSAEHFRLSCLSPMTRCVYALLLCFPRGRSRSASGRWT
jgi:hypothetical protein